MIEKNKINKILIYKLIKALANRVDIHKLFNQQLKTLQNKEIFKVRLREEEIMKEKNISFNN